MRWIQQAPADPPRTLLDERYWGAWPDPAELRAMPSGNLGQAYARWFAAAGEPALSAINVMHLRWPGSAMLLGADLMRRC